MDQTEKKIRDELEAAREKLARLGRNVSGVGTASDEGRLESNFELPYSSMPKIMSSRWHESEKIA